MLGPHHREDAELGPVRLAPKRAQDSLIFLFGETMLGDDIRRDRGFAHGAAHSRAPLGRLEAGADLAVGLYLSRTCGVGAAALPAVARCPPRVGLALVERNYANAFGGTDRDP